MRASELLSSRATCERAAQVFARAQRMGRGTTAAKEPLRRLGWLEAREPDVLLIMMHAALPGFCVRRVIAT